MELPLRNGTTDIKSVKCGGNPGVLGVDTTCFYGYNCIVIKPY